MASDADRTDTPEGPGKETSPGKDTSPAPSHQQSKRRRRKQKAQTHLKIASEPDETIPEDAGKEESEEETSWSPSHKKSKGKGKKQRRSPSPEFDSKAGENKLRPAGDIISRIIWDPEFEEEDYIIGYLDRFEGVLEVSMANWKDEVTDEEFIPQHRVLYFKQEADGEIVWDRKRRIDKIFLSGNSASPELAFLA